MQCNWNILLFRFFKLLGSVFGFVSSDVESKIEILEKYRNDSENGSHYGSLQALIQWESEQSLLKDSKRPSGARTFLRLHRALEFLALFMKELSALTLDAATAACARDCYHKTLAKHHPWYIKKSASLAMYALPYKKVLLERAFSGQENSSTDHNVEAISEEANKKMEFLANLSSQVFDLVEEVYKKDNLLDLP